ncbi:MAG: efflux RND transporter periplasmic adaptor subunit [Vicinamibacterales bacterium]|nr:efflux RND transporter periplasmic adaptor subunit [Vicinamibacterales bacterium]
MSHTSTSLLGVLLLSSALATAACGGAPEDAAPDAGTPLEVETTTAARAALPQALEGGGLVQATLTATVASRLLADVRTVHVTAGDQVRRGQPLVTLDDRDLAASRAQADASATAVTQSRAAAHAERAAAVAALSLAEVTHGRIAGLHEKRAATTQELDQARATLTAAEARLAAIDARLTEVAAAITAAEAARDGAAIGLSHTVLRAPFDGIVGLVSVDPGNQVAPGTPVARIESPGRRVDISLDAARAAGVAVGDAAEVWLDDRPDPIPGAVTEIARTVEAGLQSVTLKIALASGTEAAVGRFARVRVAGAPREALAVPDTAIVRRGQLTAVFVVDADQRARFRLVSAGGALGGRTEILAGLEAGETVLVAPPAHLVDGAPVTTRGGRR